MYFMYVDESGDTGVVGKSKTATFILTGLVAHESVWRENLDRLIAFRKRMRSKYGLKLGEEIHAGVFINDPSSPLKKQINSHDRLAIIRNHADEIAQMKDLNIINVIVTKKATHSRNDIFDIGWQALIQRFANTMQHRNFPGTKAPIETGLVICDRTDLRLNKLLRKMRRFNYVPHNATHGGVGGYSAPVLNVLEDPTHRESHNSYFLQAADTVAYILRQREKPNKIFRKTGARNYFLRVKPVLCLYACTNDPVLGIVRL